ncbi:hypothetical protein ACLOJK_002576 [Asimina triloba]
MISSCSLHTLLNFAVQRIPQAFLRHINHGAHQTGSVKGPNGNVWHLDLVEDAKGLLFQDGWKEFARENCLEVGYLLIFRYDGNSCFTMQVFDTSGCDRSLAKSGRGGSCISVKEVAAPLVPQQSGQKTKGRRQIVLRRRLTRHPTWVNRTNLPNATPRMWVLNSILLRAVKLSRSIKQIVMFGCCTTAVDKRHYGSLISERRNVTEKEKMKAVDKANSLKLQNSSVALVMLPHRVYHGFFVLVPSSAIVFGISIITDMALSATKPGAIVVKCTVHFIINESMHEPRSERGALSRGWKCFCLHNNLEEGDVCVFERVENREMRVHIFRVVEEIAPLISNCTAGAPVSVLHHLHQGRQQCEIQRDVQWADPIHPNERRRQAQPLSFVTGRRLSRSFRPNRSRSMNPASSSSMASTSATEADRRAAAPSTPQAAIGSHANTKQFAAPSDPSNARPGNPSRPNPMPDPTPAQIDPAVPPTFSTHHAVLSAIEGITASSVGGTTHLHPANDHLLRSILTAIMDHTTGHSLGIPKSINTSSPESMIQPFASITARISHKNPDDGQPATAHRPTASNARTHYHASNSSPMLAARSTSSVRNRPCQRAATTHLGQMPSSNDAHQSRQHLNTGQAPCNPTARPCQRHTQHASSSPCAIIKIINSMETCQPNLGRDG